MSINAVLYRGPDSDLTLPIRLLKAEQIRWVVKDDVSEMMRLSKGRTNPASGWLAYFPAFSDGATDWKQIYRVLDKRGLLLC